MQCIMCQDQTIPWLYMPIDPVRSIENKCKNFVICRNCRLGSVETLPSVEEVASFYQFNQYYTHGNSHIKDVCPGFFDKVLHHLAWRVDHGITIDAGQIRQLIPVGGKVCDLGCGEGNVLKRLNAQGFDTIGVDPDGAARMRAAESGVRVLEGTCEEVPDALSDQQFDLVLMLHVIEHCRNPMRALRNAFRLTKPGGLLFCEAPNCEATHFERFNVCSAMFDAPRHLFFFTPDALRKAVERSGFQQILPQYSGFARHHHVSWRRWEVEIFDRTYLHENRPLGRRHTLFRSIMLLIETAFATPAKKYDSVGVFARRPAA